MTTENTHPTLLMVRGLPGSGKSYLAMALSQALGQDNVVILDPDATDYNSPEYLELSKSLSAEGVDEKFHPYRYLRGKAYKAIENNQIIIWNQAFTNLDGFNKTVANLQTYAEEHDAKLPLLVVEVEINHDTAKARVTERADQGGHDVNEEAWERFFGDYRSFSDEGFNTVSVNGENDVNASVAAVQQALEALWKQ
jgi:predicted ABC-type ATPase